MQETAGDALRETYDSWFGNALMGVQVENSDANNNDQKNIARVLNDKKSLVDELKDDLEKVEQRNADMAELDEHDEFLAEESARLKRSLGQAGGRPKKSRMSVLDLSSYLSCLCACRHVMLDVYVCVSHVVCVRCCRASPLQFAIGGQRFRTRCRSGGLIMMLPWKKPMQLFLLGTAGCLRTSRLPGKN